MRDQCADDISGTDQAVQLVHAVHFIYAFGGLGRITPDADRMCSQSFAVFSKSGAEISCSEDQYICVLYTFDTAFVMPERMFLIVAVCRESLHDTQHHAKDMFCNGHAISAGGGGEHDAFLQDAFFEVNIDAGNGSLQPFQIICLLQCAGTGLADDHIKTAQLFTAYSGNRVTGAACDEDDLIVSCGFPECGLLFFIDFEKDKDSLHRNLLCVIMMDIAGSFCRGTPS